MQSAEQGRALTADLEERAGLSFTNRPGPVGAKAGGP